MRVQEGLFDLSDCCLVCEDFVSSFFPLLHCLLDLSYDEYDVIPLLRVCE